MNSSQQNPRIHPAAHVIMRLPGTDLAKNPWTGEVIESGRNMPDDAPVEQAKLLPPFGQTPAEVTAEANEQLIAAAGAKPVDDKPREQFQFTVGELMLDLTITCMALAAVQFIPLAPLAAAVGLLTLLFWWYSSYYQNRLLQTLGYGMLSVYLIVLVAALAQVFTAAS